MNQEKKQTRSIPAHTVTKDAIDRLLTGAVQAASDLNAPVAIAIVDVAGHLKGFTRLDDAMFMTIDIAIDKAWTAAAFGIPTHTWGQMLRQNELLSQYSHRPRLVAVPGGYPLIANGNVVGGIGVSGGRQHQDRQISEDAIHLAGFDLPSEMALSRSTE